MLKRLWLILAIFLIISGLVNQAASQVTIEEVVVWIVLRSDGTMEVEYNLTFMEHDSRDRVRKLGPFEDDHSIESAVIVHNSEIREVSLSKVDESFYSVIFGFKTSPGEEYTVSIRYEVNKPVVIEKEMFGKQYVIFSWAPFQWELPIKNETIMIVMPVELPPEIARPEQITQELIDNLGVGYGDLTEYRWSFYPTVDKVSGRSWLSIYISKTDLEPRYHFLVELYIPSVYFTLAPSPTAPPVPTEAPGPLASYGWAIIGAATLIMCGSLFMYLSRRRRRPEFPPYEPPEIEIETFEVPEKVPELDPPEAALLISSADRVITLIALGLMEKGIIKITSLEPPKYSVNAQELEKSRKELKKYELKFIEAIRDDGSIDEEELRSILREVAYSLNEKA
ncbi:MAG: hypothetical protein DRO05_05055, partial [Thermoproteota archaeon]